MMVLDCATRSGRHLLLRELIASDIEQIQNTFQQTDVDIDDMFLDTLINHPEYGQRMAVALIDGELAGRFRISFNQFDVDKKYSSNIGFIKDISVLEPFRHDGVGSRLLEFAETMIIEHGKQYAGLRITCENPAPIQFALKHGYTNMFIDLPDAFDLYKDLNHPKKTLTDDEVVQEAQRLFMMANEACRRQGLQDVYVWP